ncbi:hypothetical protein GCM10023195_22760 [Actinoallomurus liliacearum]|uniref:Uncharacterized protein n=1 Tax=Actinoallomurus liliacearum TaxID=1080073 RepID=A0ABP8TIH7_9ACTN
MLGTAPQAAPSRSPATIVLTAPVMAIAAFIRAAPQNSAVIGRPRGADTVFGGFITGGVRMHKTLGIPPSRQNGR